MTTSEHEPSPDIALGHHPDFGIVAANPKQSAAATWMLKGLGFRPVPGHPVLYALADQQRDGHGRATRAVAFLRESGYQVDVDAAFDPTPSSSTARDLSGPPRVDPDVVFAEHPRLGVVAATTDDSSLGGRILEKHGWQHDPGLDIYTLPDATDRSEAVHGLVRATLAMRRAGLQVAVQPPLAQEAVARRLAGSPATARRERDRDPTTHTSPAEATAGLARTNSPGETRVPVPRVPALAARPVDPRIAFSRNR